MWLYYVLDIINSLQLPAQKQWDSVILQARKFVIYQLQHYVHLMSTEQFLYYKTRKFVNHMYTILIADIITIYTLV